MLSLRGNGRVLLDLQGVYERWESNNGTYIHFSLLEKIKGESLDKSHLIPGVKSQVNGSIQSLQWGD